MMPARHSPVTGYLCVYVALLMLLALTVEASRHDLGHWNFPVTLVIAMSKAVLIALIFMHVWQSPPLMKLVVAASLGWLLIMFGLSASDYTTRFWDIPKGELQFPASATGGR